uniref:Uncharacterized protein n=1 Tax=Bionectria ochroleuca TaxID=29856 RepID=A0A8H7TTV0_BIOOC
MPRTPVDVQNWPVPEQTSSILDLPSDLRVPYVTEWYHVGISVLSELYYMVLRLGPFKRNLQSVPCWVGRFAIPPYSPRLPDDTGAFEGACSELLMTFSGIELPSSTTSLTLDRGR